MAHYADIHTNANLLRLKVDVHQYFDRRPRFAIVPKYGKMVVHIFNIKSMEAREAIELYHNVPLTLVEQEPRFLLARFAWTIFPLLEVFLKQGIRRKLLIRTNNGVMASWEDADSCHQIWASARPRSASPTKRQRNDLAEQKEAFETTVGDMSDSEYISMRYRGRKRRRTLSLSSDRGSQSTTNSEGVRCDSQTSNSRDAKLLVDLKY